LLRGYSKGEAQEITVGCGTWAGKAHPLYIHSFIHTTTYNSVLCTPECSVAHTLLDSRSTVQNFGENKRKLLEILKLVDNQIGAYQTTVKQGPTVLKSDRTIH
jgi:hypothetical protein